MEEILSGSFETKDSEIEIVKTYLNKNNIPYVRADKYADPSAGDVRVKYINNLYGLYEVKQESYKRFSKYGQYGIDFISAFQFKNCTDRDKWKGIHKPEEFTAFRDAIDINATSFKWGKIVYSYSDIWLFYVVDENGEIAHLETYSGKKLKELNFLQYLIHNCSFAINRKDSGLSSTDTYDSATFFISPEQMAAMRATEDDLYHNADALKFITA